MCLLILCGNKICDLICFKSVLISGSYCRQCCSPHTTNNDVFISNIWIGSEADQIFITIYFFFAVYRCAFKNFLCNYYLCLKKKYSAKKLCEINKALGICNNFLILKLCFNLNVRKSKSSDHIYFSQYVRQHLTSSQFAVLYFFP